MASQREWTPHELYRSPHCKRLLHEFVCFSFTAEFGSKRMGSQTLQLTNIYWAHTHTSLHGTRYSSKKISRNKERRRNQERRRRRSFGHLWCRVKRSPWPWIRWGLGRGRCVSSASLAWHGSGTPPVSLSSPGVSSPGPSYAKKPLGNWLLLCRTPSGTWWKLRRKPWPWGPRHSSSSWLPGWGM